ncbi:MAG: NAD(P)H-dependent oxidoreductase [Candidatus Methanomethylophilus sp.]|nr:NAD(P)H-dependent oxidoreductase [Methanomethylophilus sp.]
MIILEKRRKTDPPAVLSSDGPIPDGMQNVPRILAVVGSLREQSLNRQLAVLAGQALGNRAVFEVLDYRDIPLFDQDEEFPAPAAVARVRRQVLEADALWFFSPEYNHFFPGVLKNLVDWLSRPPAPDEPPVLVGKPAALSGISPGQGATLQAQDHLVTLLSFLDVRLMNVPRLAIPRAAEQLTDGKLILRDSAPYLQRQADAFLAFITQEQRP